VSALPPGPILTAFLLLLAGPLALALPAGWEATAIVIVVQSLVELFAMLVFLWLEPRHLMPGR
jgi:ACR3 family arsenite efflux pump ArsB